MNLISICIPAYKNTDYLSRLLDSLVLQGFRDFEVIVTDDSPDESVKELCFQYKERLPLNYFRNPKALGTPENWNEAIRRASGKWIKLMHDDDWFVDENSLENYAATIKLNPAASFIFSAYRNIYLKDNSTRDIFAENIRYHELKKNPVSLLSKNIIGPPSAVIHKNEGNLFYDNKLKWLVDIDFYIRYLASAEIAYNDKILVNIGIGDQQVTLDCFRQRPVEIPENFSILNKAGTKNLKNSLVYDAWWRLMRNLQITKPGEIRQAGYTGIIPPVILSMISWQSKIPAFLLNMGILSKTLMAIHFVLNRNKI